MASTTSIISLVVLLLATYCYSIPIGQGNDISTSEYDFSTGRTMVPREEMFMQMDEKHTQDHFDMNREDTTERYMHGGMTDFHTQEQQRYPKRGANEDDSVTTERFMQEKPKRDTDESDEVTTERFMQEKPKRGTDESDEVTTERSMDEKPKRGTDESDEVTTERSMEEKPKRGTDDDDRNDETTVEGHFEKDDKTVDSFAASSERQNNVRAFEDDSFSTMESSTEFNDRATRFEKVASEDKKTHDAQFSGMEKTSTFEPTSSGESFGKSTGLLQQDQMEEKFTTSRYDNEHVPLTEQHITKTETIIPGKIYETKIYSGLPGRTYVVDETMTIRPSQLSQGETYEHNSKPMSRN